MSTSCAYCRRSLRPRGEVGPLEHTRDHIIPKSKKGRKTVPACWQCNNIKGDMMPEEWAIFMAANPEWWVNVRGPGMSKKPPPWRETCRFLHEAGLRALRKHEAIPLRYDDPLAQAAYEAAYKDRKWLLRVPTTDDCPQA